MKTYQLLKNEEVEGLRVGRFKYRINTTCILYRLGSTIIDTGPANQWSVVKKFLSEKEVKQVLITHHHEDHGGNACSIKKHHSIPIYAHPNGIKNYKSGFSLKFYEYVVWGKPKPFEAEPLPFELLEEEGFRLEAIHSPGHADDMVCYYEPEKGWMFTGDLFIASKPKYIRPDEDPNQEIESIKKILTYDFNKVFCSHRGIILDGKRALRNKLDYLETLRDNAWELHKKGKSIDEITTLLIGKESITSMLTLYHFSKRNMIKAFLSSPPKVVYLAKV